MTAFQVMMQLLPVLEQAIEIICRAEGVTPEQAFNRLISHLTPGKPNVPELGAK
jgi:hypothetical protein